MLSMILILVLSILAIVFPPAVACSAVFLMGSDTYGIGQYNLVPGTLLTPIYLLAIARAFQHLWQQKAAGADLRRMKKIALIALGISSWAGLSCFMGGASPVLSAYIAMQGVTGMIFALAYHRDRLASIFLLSMVGIQLVIAAVLLLFPGSPLDAVHTNAFAGTPQELWAFESASDKDSGQFANAVQLGFYGGVGIIIGMFFLTQMRRLSLRLMGLAFACLGILISILTIERGIWIGVAAGTLTLLLKLCRNATQKGLLVVGLLLASLTLSLSSSQIVTSRIEHFRALSEDTYRIPIALKSFDFVMDNPLFGAHGDCRHIVDVVGGAPHQGFYFMATMYGLPAGLALLALTWYAFVPCIRDRYAFCKDKRVPRDLLCLARAISFAIISMALTNDMSAGMLGWLCLGYACLPWIYETALPPMPGARRKGVTCK